MCTARLYLFIQYSTRHSINIVCNSNGKTIQIHSDDCSASFFSLLLLHLLSRLSPSYWSHAFYYLAYLRTKSPIGTWILFCAKRANMQMLIASFLCHLVDGLAQSQCVCFWILVSLSVFKNYRWENSWVRFPQFSPLANRFSESNHLK